MYHSVSDSVMDPSRVTVSPEHFGEQMQVLRERFRPVGLSDYLERVRRREDLRNVVVVTFDDGYANNLRIAAPILKDLDIPAVFYIATGYLGGEREFWWDELEQLVFGPESLPDRLPDDGPHSNDPDISGLSRVELYWKLWHALVVRPADSQRQLLDRLGAWSGAQPCIRESHRPMTPDELVELSSIPGFEIGAHSKTHPRLSELEPSMAGSEIRDSAASIQNLLPTPVRHFSYPYGALSEEVKEMVRAAGFQS